MRFWKRAADVTLRRLMRQFPCVCILGARQVGKTTLAKKAYPRASYYDLESPSLRDRVRLAPDSFLGDAGSPTILDEIQFLPELWEYLKVEIDSKRSLLGRFLVLGSAHPELIRKASESLAGRMGFLDLDPLAAYETGKGQPALDPGQLWLRGGYPDAAKLRDAHARTLWMDSYMRTFIERDLREEGVEANSGLMRKVLSMLAHVHGGIWNASQLAASAGVSYHTVNRYVDILERSFLVRRLPPYFVNIGKRLVKSPKVYIRDSGLLHHLLGIRKRDDLLNSPYCGASWEGFIVEGILRHLRLVEPSISAFYYRTQTGMEADLILESGNTRMACEIKFGSVLDKRWIERLRAVMEDVGATRGALIYSGNNSFSIDAHIKVYRAEDFAYLKAMASL